MLASLFVFFFSGKEANLRLILSMHIVPFDEWEVSCEVIVLIFTHGDLTFWR